MENGHLTACFPLHDAKPFHSKLYRILQKLLNINFFANNFGEGFEFNHKQVIKLNWEHTGKDLIAEQLPTEAVLIAVGLKLTNTVNVVLKSLKETETFETISLIGSHLLKFSNNCMIVRLMGYWLFKTLYCNFLLLLNQNLVS